MKALLAMIVVGLCCLTARAEDWTVNGKDYHNVKVTQVDADKVHITFDGGLGSVPLADLPPDLQKRFNYDPQAAKQAQKAEDERLAESDKQRAAAEAKQKIAEAMAERDELIKKRDALLQSMAEQKSFKATQVVDGGILCDDSNKLIFVSCATQDLAEGQTFSTYAYKDGTYTYTDTQGASRTVEKWIPCDKPASPAKGASIDDDVLKSAP